jgi:hypothetical protein
MDQNVLVTAGRNIVSFLDEEGIPPRAALWVYSTDNGTWKFWVVPPQSIKDQREFYRHIARGVSQNRDKMGGVDASDVEMVKDTHPAIQALSRVIRARDADVRMTNNMLNGFFLPDGIVLRMDLPP